MKKFLGRNLKIARLSLRLSVKDLASKLQVSGQLIYDYEKNKRSPSFEILRKLSIILDKHHLYFFKKLDDYFTENDPHIFICYNKNNL